VVRFLRLRNREGFDVYARPYAGNRKAGYILLDRDVAAPGILPTMRAQRQEPCVVVRTSCGSLQAWVRVSETPLEPALATQIRKHLAHTYGGDWPSTDWRNLGRLAGFTNQKSLRRHPSGYAPWVKVLYAQVGLASQGLSLVQAAQGRLSPTCPRPAWIRSDSASRPGSAGSLTPHSALSAGHWTERWKTISPWPLCA
jgi:hypothetical protein